MEWRRAELEAERIEQERDVELRHRSFLKDIGAIGCGMGRFRCSERLIEWWTFPEGTSVDEALDRLRLMGISVDGTENRYAWSPTGLWFNRAARAKVLRSGRLHVTMQSALDI
jgi:hypothetical protein